MGDEVKLYVDGALQTSNRSLNASTNTNNFGNNPIYLFSRGGTTQFDSGTIDDFRVYADALTATQIQQIYACTGLETPTQLINYVQGNYATPPTLQTTVNVPFTGRQGAGDLNIVVVGWHDSSAAVNAISDSTGNKYARAVGPTVVNGQLSQSIYYAKNIGSAAAGANSVAVTFSHPAINPDVRILEYSGADPANPVDVTAANSGSGTSSSSGWASTTNAMDLIFGANVVSGQTSGPGMGFTQRLLTPANGHIAEDEMVTATGSYGATARQYCRKGESGLCSWSRCARPVL